MWVLPKNYQTSLAFVPDMVASKEDLTLLAPTIGSSLMWRSKPSPLPTWSRRWSRVSWMPHLFGRILKPSQHTSFETALTSSLAAIRASRSARQANDRERTIPVTSGHTSEDMTEQLDLFNASSKTSKVTSRLDSTASSAIWKKMVTTQRSEYSQRLKSARLTRESASSFLPTPSATPYGTSNNGQRGDGTTFKQAGKPSLESMARHNLWPTPSVKGNYNRKGASQRSGDGLETAVIPRACGLSFDEFRQRYVDAVHLARNGKSATKARTPLIISSLGGRGVRTAVAVVAPPSIGTLFVGSSHWEPESGPDGMTLREVVRLNLAFDHRWMNGVGATSFVADIRDAMENFDLAKLD